MRSSFLFKKKRTNKTNPKLKRGYRKEANAAFKRAYERLSGSQGGASPVRKIDPATGEVIGIIHSDSLPPNND